MTTGSSLPEDKSEDLFLDIAWFSKMNAKWRKIPKYKVVDEINFWLLVWNWLIDKTKCFPVPTYCRLVKNDHQLGNWEIVKLRIRLRVVQANPFSFFDINVGRSRIRHKTTLNFNDDSINFETIEIWLIFQNPESFYVGSDFFRQWFQKRNEFGLDYP